MKNNSEAKYIKIGLTIFLSISGCILFYYLLFFGTDLKRSISQFFSVFTSIILGISIAYILNPLMVFVEEKVTKPICVKLLKSEKGQKKCKKVSRAFAVLFTIIFFILLLYGLVSLIVPQVIESIRNIIFRIPQYLSNLNKWMNGIFEKHPELNDLPEEDIASVENWFSNSLVPKLQEFLSATSSSLVGSVFSIFNGVLNFIIGIIVSIYLLMSKELFCAQAKKIAYALLREERANNLINNMRYGNKIFGGFITGKLLDSVIIGVICYICMVILKMPYAALISVVVGVTNIIPYFGPFIGAIPSAIIILMVNPMKCLTFVIFILILQQFDGNILGPKILGESTGLSSFWVIFSITLFSGFFGIVGMFIGVPVFAVIYAAIKTFINKRLEKKCMPVETEYYKVNDFHNSDIYDVNTGKEFKFVKKTFENIHPEDNEQKESNNSFGFENIDDLSSINSKSDDKVD